MAAPAAPGPTGPALPPGALPAVAVRRIVLGLLPAIFLGAIDQSIVPIALLTIGRELGDVSLIAWVMAGYLVAGTVATPIYGKLSDLHGRRRMITVSLCIAMAGSLLCALSQSMPMLIASRVLQGLGSGAIFALAQAAVADVVAGPERGRYQGYFSGVFASAAVAAPLLGGVLTEHLSWRVIFLINLPLALLALWRARSVLVEAPAPRRDAHIDWWGAALLAAGLGVPLVALSRIGQGAPWLGGSTLALAALGVALLAAWAWRESSAAEPIVPLSLFGKRTVLACCAVTFTNFFVLIGCTVLLPLSMQTVDGARPEEVAMRLVALTLSVPAGAFFAGRLMLRAPDMGRFAASGCALSALALAGLLLAPSGRGTVALLAMLPLGAGLGITLPTVLVAAQMAVGPGSIGVVTSLVAFFRSLGGVIGIAVLTSLVLAGAGGASLADADPRALAPAFERALGVSAVMSTIGAAVALRIGSRVTHPPH
jgi:MFS family permease